MDPQLKDLALDSKNCAGKTYGAVELSVRNMSSVSWAQVGLESRAPTSNSRQTRNETLALLGLAHSALHPNPEARPEARVERRDACNCSRNVVGLMITNINLTCI